MLVRHENAPVEQLYKAYRYTVCGKLATYLWTYDNSGREERCITYLQILDETGTEVYSYSAGNNVIFKAVFDRHIDNILWYMMNESTNPKDLTELITHVLTKNPSLFSYRIENQKMQERNKVLAML